MNKQLLALYCAINFFGSMYGMDSHAKKHFKHHLRNWEKHALQRGWHKDLAAEDAPQMNNKDHINEAGLYAAKQPAEQSDRQVFPESEKTAHNKALAVAIIINKQVEANKGLSNRRSTEEQFGNGFQW